MALLADATDAKPVSKTAILVAGMHRSGTSALTRVISLLGAALPRNLLSPAFDNETGFWEPSRVVALHDKILTSVHSHWSGLAGPPEGWFDSPPARACVKRIKRIVVAEYGDAPLIVVKDPRLSLLFPLWSRALDELGFACKAVIAVRNPVEIVQSMAWREHQRHSGEPWRPDRAALLFVRYHIAAERWTRSHPRTYVHYDDLLSDWRETAIRLSESFQLVWPCWSVGAETEVDRFLSTSHRHHRAADGVAPESELWRAWVDPVYSAVRSACSSRAMDPALFDRIQAAYDSAYGASARNLVASTGAAAKIRSIVRPLNAGGAINWRERIFGRRIGLKLRRGF